MGLTELLCLRPYDAHQPARSLQVKASVAISGPLLANLTVTLDQMSQIVTLLVACTVKTPPPKTPPPNCGLMTDGMFVGDGDKFRGDNNRNNCQLSLAVSPLLPLSYLRFLSDQRTR